VVSALTAIEAILALFLFMLSSLLGDHPF